MTGPNVRERILPRLIEDELKESFLDYSMSVIVQRALPDVRDGLKPVHRRILYAMHELGLVPGRPYKKAATVVGDVLGKYHPHGDIAVYDSLVRMVQDFSLRYPLIDGQGNFGSVDGDSAAAYRYTEARLTRVAMTMLEDIDKATVDFVPNFDDRLQEPTVLPGRLPNLIVNGSAGIAVGMTTNIPPHNLSEVVQAIVHLVDHPNATIREIRKFVKGPDFPTGAIIYGREGIKECYEEGRGRIVIRLRASAEGADPRRAAAALHRAPPHRHHAPHPVRIAARAGPRAHPRRLEDRRRQHRRSDQAHQEIEGHAERRRRLAQALQALGEAVRRNPQHAAGAPHRPRDHQARGGAEGRPQVHQGMQRDSRLEAAAHEDPQGGAHRAGARLC